MSPNPHGKAVVLGLGLIGASLAGALRRTGWFEAVVGVDVAAAAREEAVARGLVDQAQADLGPALVGARVVVLATHVRHVLATIPTLGLALPEGAWLFDVASTKGLVVEAYDHLPDGVRALGGHPMTGRRSAGVAAADASLFEAKPFFLVPCRHTTPALLAEAEALVGALGARPLVIDAERHDRLVALVSHLPRLLPVALALAAEAAHDELTFAVAAGGFREATRPTGDAVAMWRDVLATNPRGIAEAVRHFAAELDLLAGHIARGDTEGLEEALWRAKTLVDGGLGAPGPGPGTRDDGGRRGGP